MIVIPKLAIGYQDIPKAASTSVFRWFYDCLKGEGLLNSDGVAPGKNFVRRHFKAESGNAEMLLDAQLNGEIADSTFRFAITRDPVKRFLSMYSNRVIAHRKLSVKLRAADTIRDAGLELDPEINQLVYRLDEYRAVSADIAHHSAPMIDFLGADLPCFSKMVDISAIDTLAESIKAWWRERGMTSLADGAPPIGRMQTGGPKLGLEILERDAFDKLLDFYRQDYDALVTVDRDRIIDEYEEAVSSRPKPKPYHFLPIAAYRNAKCSKPQRKPLCTSSTLEVLQAREDIPILYSSVDLTRQEPEPSGYNGLKGVVVMHSRMLEKRWRVVVADGHGEHEALWGIASPQMAERFPASRQAAHARFLVEGLRVDDEREIQLFLVREDGYRFLIGQLQPRVTIC